MREIEIKFKPWVKISDEQFVRPGFVGKKEALTMFVLQKSPAVWQWSILSTGAVRMHWRTRKGRCKTAIEAKHAAERAMGLQAY